MKSIWRKLTEGAIVLVVLAAVCSVVVVKPLLAQTGYAVDDRSAVLRGFAPNGTVINVKLLSDGTVTVNSPTTWVYSSVQVSSALATQLTVANPLRKALLILNQSTYGIFTGLTSPISASNAYSQPAATAFPPSGNAIPTNAIYVTGQQTGAAQTVVIFEGQ